MLLTIALEFIVLVYRINASFFFGRFEGAGWCVIVFLSRKKPDIPAFHSANSIINGESVFLNMHVHQGNLNRRNNELNCFCSAGGNWSSDATSPVFMPRELEIDKDFYDVVEKQTRNRPVLF